MKKGEAAAMSSIKHELSRTKAQVAQWKDERRLREDFEIKAKAVQDEKIRLADRKKHKKHVGTQRQTHGPTTN